MQILENSKTLAFCTLYILLLVSQYHGISTSAEALCGEEQECEISLKFKTSKTLAEGYECIIDEGLLVGILCQILGAQQYFDLISEDPISESEDELPSNYTCEMAKNVMINTDDPCQEKIDIIQSTLTSVSAEIAKMIMWIITNPEGYLESICQYQHDVKCLQLAFDGLEADFAWNYAALVNKIDRNLKKYQESLTVVYRRITELEVQLTEERLGHLAAWLQSGKPGVFGEFNRFFPLNRGVFLTTLVNASLYEGLGMPIRTGRYMGYIATFVKTIPIENVGDRWLAIKQCFETLLTKKEHISEAMLILNQVAIDEFASEDWMRQLMERIARYTKSFIENWEFDLKSRKKEAIQVITDFANSLEDQPISQKSVSSQLPPLITKLAEEEGGAIFETLFEFALAFNHSEHLLLSLTTIKKYAPPDSLFHLLLKIKEAKSKLSSADPINLKFTELINSFPTAMRNVAGDCIFLRFGSTGTLAGSTLHGSNKDYIHRHLTYSESNRRWKFEPNQMEQRSKSIIPSYNFRLKSVDMLTLDLKHEYLSTHLNWEENDYGEGFVRTTIPPESHCWHPLHYYWRVEFLPEDGMVHLFHEGMEAYFHSGLALRLYQVPSNMAWKVEECT